MLSLKHIKSFTLSLLLTGIGATTTYAAELTSEEKIVCSTLRVCVDIIRRHDATQFDYTVLEREFRRFGPAGRKALIDVLESKAGNADIAQMIANGGPLSPSEKRGLKAEWSLDRAETLLPFLLDGDLLSRDLLLRSLGSDNPNVREKARLALKKLPLSVQNQPVPQNLIEPLLRALSKDPIAEAAPYLARLNPAGHEDAFSEILKSGNTDLASAAYAALYRNNPSAAFKTLLSEMDAMNSPADSRAIGNMLLRRNKTRPDGFYLKFAGDISGDQARSVAARASGLHALLVSGPDKLPKLTPARAEALRFLVSGQPFVTQDEYLPKLKYLKAEVALDVIWKVASEEAWINRDRISSAFAGLQSKDMVIADLIRSDDFRSFSAGVAQAKSSHAALLRAKINDPISAIRDLARKKLELPPAPKNTAPCIISKFDSQDRLNQMPFFDLPWMTTNLGVRLVLDRKYLTAAHPTQSGWLAGYDLQAGEMKSRWEGAALMFFDNKTGDFKQIGDFTGPRAILPDRLLKLGQSTNRVWVINQWDGEPADVSAYYVDLTGALPQIKHLGAVPNSAKDFSVAPNGDLLMRFEEKTQAPIRISRRGNISLACRSLPVVSSAPAPN